MTESQAAKAVRGARRREANMHESENSSLQDYDDYIARALRTEGGHLSIGRGGYI